VVVLAAGRGQRLGLGPKAHIDLAGRSFLARVVHACREARLGPIWVVGRRDDPVIAASAAALGARVVLNESPERGMSSSVRLGLESSRRAKLAGVLVFPVDYPLVRSATVAAVARAVLEPTGRAWARPTHAEQGGHPIAFQLALVEKILHESAELPLRDALRLHGGVAMDVPCDDAATLHDIDTPAELEAARLSLALR